MASRTSVLIVGGSLNGLTMALLLAHHGVDCIVVERHPNTTVQYKFRGISPRSMEIYRGLGIQDEIRAHVTGDQKAGDIATAKTFQIRMFDGWGSPGRLHSQVRSEREWRGTCPAGRRDRVASKTRECRRPD